VILWRISNQVSLRGDGALRVSGRWHTRGRRIVYCAQTPAAALLEVVVHLEIEIRDLPVRYRLLKLEAPDDLILTHLAVDDLPSGWVENVPVTQAIGDAWLQSRRSPLFSVPSALVPETFNILFNPDHQDGHRVVLHDSREYLIDHRLLG
jgi:RES domain-containing protein